MNPKHFQGLFSLLLTTLCLHPAKGTEISLSQGDITEKQSLAENTVYSLTENIDIQNLNSVDNEGGSVFVSSSFSLTFQGNDLYNLIISKCSSTGSGFDSNSPPSSISQGSGAICGSNVLFQNLGELGFHSCTSVAAEIGTTRSRIGGAVSAQTALDFLNIRKITAIGNSAGGAFHYDMVSSSDMFGGAFCSWSTMTFDHVGDLFFENNLVGDKDGKENFMTLRGGALYARGLSSAGGAMAPSEYAITLKNITGSVTFANNGADLNLSDQFDGYGGALFAGSAAPYSGHAQTGGGILFSQIKGDILFLENIARTSGGAIYSQHDVIFKNTGSITFSENIARGGYGTSQSGAIHASYGLVSFSSITGNILFSGNKSLSGSVGAIIATYGIHFENVTGNIVFKQNAAAWVAGAITTENGLIFINTGNVLFEENSAGISGGAVYLTGANKHSIFSADNGNITFRGNTEKRSGSFDYLNSVRLENGIIADFRAQKDREISFFDPLRDNSQGENSVLDYNRTEGMDTAPYGSVIPNYCGVIRFSGLLADKLITRHADAGETEEAWISRLGESKYTKVSGKSTLHGGTFILEHGVTYGDRDLTKNSSFLHRGGYLEMTTGSSLNAKNITFSGRNAILRTDNTAVVSADHIDMSQGFSFDFLPFLDNHNSGISLAANILTLGGVLGVSDKNIDHYTDNRWAQHHEFLVLDTTKVVSTSGSLIGIISNLTDKTIIDSPYTYNGTWDYQWKDSNGDGTDDRLYAIWAPAGNTPDPEPDPIPPVDPISPVDPIPPVNPDLPYIKEVSPELAGTIIPNSLWSSISNVNALTDAVMGQIDNQRFYFPKEHNFWFSGLGDFSKHDSASGKDGYDYTGGGYALGADTQVLDNLIAGAALGNLFGTSKSKLYNSQIRQDSCIGTLYSAGYTNLNDNNKLLLQGQLSYGYTDNKVSTAYSDGDYSRGSWDNDTWSFSLQAAWNRNLDYDWTISPFVGIEYANVKQGQFTEYGDKARHFGQSRLCNLSMPIGLSLTKLSRLPNSLIWLNSLTASYVPDIYRKNPETYVERLSNGFRWTADGISPARSALRLNWNTRLFLNEKTSIFFGYSLEGRSHALYQSVNAGVSTTF